MKNPSEKWVGLGEKPLRTFILLLCLLLLFFMFSFFDSSFVEFLTAFNC